MRQRIFGQLNSHVPFYVNRLVIYKIVRRRNKKYSVCNFSKKSHVLINSENRYLSSLRSPVVMAKNKTFYEKFVHCVLCESAVLCTL